MLPSSERRRELNRLLIVDDAMFIRRMIADVASEAGWDIAGEAGDGLEAIASYDDLQPDLVTMDLVMPNLGGLEALRSIRARDPQARVIVISALDQRAALLDSISAGAADFVVKPFERDRLLAMFRKLLVQDQPLSQAPEAHGG